MTMNDAPGQERQCRCRAHGWLIAILFVGVLTGCMTAQGNTPHDAPTAAEPAGGEMTDAGDENLAHLEKRLAAQQAQIELLVPKTYASYLDGDPSYVTDLIAHIRAAATAWATYRDAHCRADPMLQGMSRRDTDALAETCRVQKTQARLREMQALLDALRSNG